MANVRVLCCLGLLLPMIVAYSCTTPQHLPPPLRDCYALLDALEILSLRPPFNSSMLWSRSAKDSNTSQQLPKSYQLRTIPPNTCGLYLDAIPSDLDAEDQFGLVNVINIAEILVERCLLNRKVGWGLPGMKQNINVSLVRVDGLGDSRNTHDVQYLTLP